MSIRLVLKIIPLVFTLFVFTGGCREESKNPSLNKHSGNGHTIDTNADKIKEIDTYIAGINNQINLDQTIKEYKTGNVKGEIKTRYWENVILFRSNKGKSSTEEFSDKYYYKEGNIVFSSHYVLTLADNSAGKVICYFNNKRIFKSKIKKAWISGDDEQNFDDLEYRDFMSTSSMENVVAKKLEFINSIIN